MPCIPSVRLIISGQKSVKSLHISAIIDSGSTSDIIRADFVDSLQLELDKTKSISFTAADGLTSKTLGQVRINVADPTKPSKKFTIFPQVSLDLPVDLILGMETLFKANIDFANNILALPLGNGQIVQLDLELNSNEKNT